MTRFFDQYKDLFEVDHKINIPTTRLTADNPLFSERSNINILPLKDLKSNSKPIDFTQQLDAFENKLNNWKTNSSKDNRFRIGSPLKQTTETNTFRRPSSKKRSINQSYETNVIQNLNQLQDILDQSLGSISIQSPLIRKISSYQVASSNIKPQPIKLQPFKRKISIRSQKSEVSQSVFNQQQFKKSKIYSKWTIQQMKLHKATRTTNAQATQKRSDAQRNLRARQNKLKALLQNKY